MDVGGKYQLVKIFFLGVIYRHSAILIEALDFQRIGVLHIDYYLKFRDNFV